MKTEDLVLHTIMVLLACIALYNSYEKGKEHFIDLFGNSNLLSKDQIKQQEDKIEESINSINEDEYINGESGSTYKRALKYAYNVHIKDLPYKPIHDQKSVGYLYITNKENYGILH